MTSFRKVVIGTNLLFFGIGLPFVAILPEGSLFQTVGKVLVVLGIFANVFLTFTLTSGPVGRVGM